MLLPEFSFKQVLRGMEDVDFLVHVAPQISTCGRKENKAVFGRRRSHSVICLYQSSAGVPGAPELSGHGELSEVRGKWLDH